MSPAFDAFADSIQPCSCRHEKWSCSFESFWTLGTRSCGRSEERRRFVDRSSLACKAARPTTEFRREFEGVTNLEGAGGGVQIPRRDGGYHHVECEGDASLLVCSLSGNLVRSSSKNFSGAPQFEVR